jgi:hypothetical protein
MTESDPRVSALFARDTRIAATDTFASAVRRRISRKRLATRVITIGLALFFVIAGAVAIVLAPSTPLDPVGRFGEFLVSRDGVAASAILATVLLGWLRFGDV